MLAGFAALLVCQLLGEALVRVLAMPVPGPVVGMVLLFVLMLVRAPLPDGTGDVASGLLRNLSLLFVPAGVGVVQHAELLGGEGVRLALVVVISTALALATTALVFAGVQRLIGGTERAKGEGPEP
jgi:holin-like protein